jgi:hypothetical protein
MAESGSMLNEANNECFLRKNEYVLEAIILIDIRFRIGFQPIDFLSSHRWIGYG